MTDITLYDQGRLLQEGGKPLGPAVAGLSPEDQHEIATGYAAAALDQFFDALKSEFRTLPPQLVPRAMKIVANAWAEWKESHDR